MTLSRAIKRPSSALSRLKVSPANMTSRQKRSMDLYFAEKDAFMLRLKRALNTSRTQAPQLPCPPSPDVGHWQLKQATQQ